MHEEQLISQQFKHRTVIYKHIHIRKHSRYLDCHCTMLLYNISSYQIVSLRPLVFARPQSLTLLFGVGHTAHCTELVTHCVCVNYICSLWHTPQEITVTVIV